MILASFWSRLLLLLIIVAPPLFIGLGNADCEFHMEVRTIAASQETWMRQQHDPHAWLMPSWNGAARVNKPPLTVWLNLLTWAGLDPATASVDQLVRRSRTVAAGLSLAALLAIVGIGTTLHSSRFGLLAAAVTGTSLLFLRNARLASYDTYLLAFSTFAIAAGLWALQCREKTPRRTPFLVGWTACGIAIAAAFLTKGPIALVMSALPLGLIALTGPRKSLSVAGLVGALALSAILILPWYLFALSTVTAAGQIMGAEFRAERTEFQPPWYYLDLILFVAPWLLWLPAYWIAAARRRYDVRQPAIRVPMLWFLAIFVVMSIPAAKQQRYIIPILPAVGLLIASAWQQIAAPRPQQWPKRLARTHSALLSLGAVLYALWGLGQSWLLSFGVLEQPGIAKLPEWSFVLVAIPLFVIAQIMRRVSVEAAAWLTALWMAIAATPALYDYGFHHHSRYAHRAEVEAVAREVGSAPLYYATTPEWATSKDWPAPAMLLYSRRMIPLWTNTIPERGSFLMAKENEHADQNFRAAGWVPVSSFDDGNEPRRLYRAPN